MRRHKSKGRFDAPMLGNQHPARGSCVCRRSVQPLTNGFLSGDARYGFEPLGWMSDMMKAPFHDMDGIRLIVGSLSNGG